MNLTHENYHSAESNLAYMSNSQYSGWMSCEAKQKAILTGAFKEPDNDAFTLGSYVDSALLTPEVLAADMEAKPDEYIWRGKPRAFVTDGNVMVNRAKRDAFFIRHITGNVQAIVTFSLYGVQWKAMLDVCNPQDSSFTDLKTVGGGLFDEKYSVKHEERVPFYETFNYWRQFAVYGEAYKCVHGEYPKHRYIAAISKQDPPDIAVFKMDNARRFKRELADIKLHLPRIMAVKSGALPATRCENCDYCRDTRVLTECVTAESVTLDSVTVEEFAKE